MLAPGQIIDGKYRIERCLAEGGMGAVFLGQNTRIGRQVAIKVLHGTLAKQGVQVERFEQEAQLLARIGSQYIVEVLDMGDLPGGDSYMIMEYLEGETLGERLQRRKQLTAEEAVMLVEQALTGLEAAHSADVVHRDIKPDNLFLVRRPEGELVKILDFGVSKIEEAAAATNARQSKLTLNGTLVGTPQYMSPEQARGHSTDHRTDVFAMGVVLFECIAGETPFVGDNMQDLLFRVALEEPRKLSSLCPDVDPGIEAIVNHATARSPEDRYQSAREFRDALREWLDERGVVSVRPRTPTHLRRIVPTPARLSSVRTSDTPANWTTPPRGIASHPDTDVSADAALAGLQPRRTSRLVGGLLAVAAAAAIVISGFALSSAAPTTAAEPPAAPVVAAAPVATTAEAPVATVEPTRAVSNPVSGPSGRGNTALAAQGAFYGRRGPVAAVGSAAPGEPVIPAAKGGPATASAAPAALPAPVAPGASAATAAVTPAVDPPGAAVASPPEASPAAPTTALVPGAAVIPATPKGRVFRRDL